MKGMLSNTVTRTLGETSDADISSACGWARCPASKRVTSGTGALESGNASAWARKYKKYCAKDFHEDGTPIIDGYGLKQSCLIYSNSGGDAVCQRCGHWAEDHVVLDCPSCGRGQYTGCVVVNCGCGAPCNYCGTPPPTPPGMNLNCIKFLAGGSVEGKVEDAVDIGGDEKSGNAKHYRGTS